MKNQTDIDDDRLLAVEVETALRDLRIATNRANEAVVRSAVEDLRRTSLSLQSSIGLVEPVLGSDPDCEIFLTSPFRSMARRAT